MSKPICIDLFCGLGGWTKGFQAAGFHVIGVDLIAFPEYPGDEFIQADITHLDGHQFAGAAAIVASPPCDEFARFRQPWLIRRGNIPAPSMELVNAAYRIRDEARPGFFLLENVRSAQYFLGQATVAREPFYFWGDAALIPRVQVRQKQSWSSRRKADRAEIPLQLAHAVALSVMAGLPVPAA